MQAWFLYQFFDHSEGFDPMASQFPEKHPSMGRQLNAAFLSSQGNGLLTAIKREPVANNIEVDTVPDRNSPHGSNGVPAFLDDLSFEGFRGDLRSPMVILALRIIASA
ncbi:hypothetical protein ACYZTX_16280 [Pseudomonas sp. MDT1-17]